MNNNKKIEKVIEWTNIKVKKFKKLPKSIKYNPKISEVWTVDMGQNFPGELSGIMTCIIVQDSNTVSTKGSVVILPIMSNGKESFPAIKLMKEDVTTMGENHYINGIVIPHQIKTISKVRLGKKIGSITESGMKKIKNSLQLLLSV